MGLEIQSPHRRPPTTKTYGLLRRRSIGEYRKSFRIPGFLPPLLLFSRPAFLSHSLFSATLFPSALRVSELLLTNAV